MMIRNINDNNNNYCDRINYKNNCNSNNNNQDDNNNNNNNNNNNDINNNGNNNTYKISQHTHMIMTRIITE